MKKLIALFLTLQFLLALPSWAQEEDDLSKSTMNDVYMVAGAGAAGAILGLSTLSFMDEPSKHVANIWTGAAIGVIVGVIFVAYSSALKGSEELQSSIDLGTTERLAWHQKNSSNLTLPSVQFGTEIWKMNF